MIRTVGQLVELVWQAAANKQQKWLTLTVNKIKSKNRKDYKTPPDQG
jgi:hypothetical protein